MSENTTVSTQIQPTSSRPQGAPPPPRRGPMGGGPFGGMAPGEKAKDFKGTSRKLIKYMGSQARVFLFIILMTIFATVLTVIAPKVMAQATNEMQSAFMTGHFDIDKVLGILYLIIGIYVASAIFSFLAQFLAAGLSQKIVYRMRADVKEKLTRLPLSYYDKNPTGDILSRITNDIDTISTSLQQSITQLITSVITVVGVMVMMFTINWILALIAIASLPLYMVITMFIVKKSQKKFVAQQKKLGSLNGYIEEIYGNRKIVKLFNKEEKSREEFDTYNKDLRDAGVGAQFLTGMIMPMFHFVNNLMYVMVCVVGGILAGARGLLIGDIQAFIQYIQQFGQPIMQLANIMNTLQSTMAAGERVFALLEAPEEPADATEPKSTENVSASVVFKDVDFSYVPDKELIKGLNLTVPAGGRIAIVGPTGAGKTTLVNLLLRFYEINGGSIMIDGTDIRDFTKKDLRALFGMVLQDTWLETGTIMENIAYGRPDASLAEVVEAAQKAHIHHYITTLPQGYDTVLNEDVTNISNGQKQLITIARAILADNKILILDEATSSVDTRTESYIQNAMTEMMSGKTSFVIAHRLSTIRSASLILVMEKGTIVEQGPHENLLTKGGAYAKLYNSQFSSETV